MSEVDNNIHAIIAQQLLSHFIINVKIPFHAVSAAATTTDGVGFA